MAKLIEFMGVSGVGKTTTYEYLRKRNSKNSGWKLHDQLWREQHSVKKILKKQWDHYLMRIFNNASTCTFKGDSLARFTVAHPELNDLFWKTLSKKGKFYGKDLRFHEVEYIKYLFEKIQRVREEASNVFCIIDEGLLHNLNYFTTNFTETEISAILDLFELPEAVVFFQGDIEIVMERITKREKVIPRDRGLTKKELWHAKSKIISEKNVVLEVLFKKKVPVLQLDAMESVDRKYEIIVSFIKNLEKTPVLKPAY